MNLTFYTYYENTFTQCCPYHEIRLTQLCPYLCVWAHLASCLFMNLILFSFVTIMKLDFSYFFHDRKASFVFIRDFNVHHKEWLNSVSHTDCHGLRGPAVLRGYFFIYRVLSTSLLSGIKCTMWNYMTPPSSPTPQKIPPTPPFMVKKKFFSKIISSYANYTG